MFINQAENEGHFFFYLSGYTSRITDSTRAMSLLSSSLIIYPDQAWLLENQLSPGGNRAERFFSLRNDGLVAGIQPKG